MAMSLFDISLQTANRFYSWGWKGSIVGAAITLIAVLLLMWGTRVRDRDFDSRMTRLNVEASESHERAAKLEERAAGLENEASQARLNLEKLRGQVSSRHLTEAQSKIIAQHLSGLPVKLTLSALASDPESMQFAGQIRDALRAAGFDVQIQSSVVFSNQPVVGLNISGPRDGVEQVADAFLKAGLPVNGQVRDGDINILVGSKPPNP
jgi:hypothetical protein